MQLNEEELEEKQIEIETVHEKIEELKDRLERKEGEGELKTLKCRKPFSAYFKTRKNF